MTRSAKVTQSDIARAIKAAQAAGLRVTECVMAAGECRLIFTDLDGNKIEQEPSGVKQWPRS